jgi:hypothetical protein
VTVEVRWVPSLGKERTTPLAKLKATTRRTAVRMLIRAPNLGPKPLAKRFPGYKVAILGDASQADWTGWQKGDVEGLAWVPSSLQVEEALDDLRTFEEVADVRLDASEAKSSPPSRRGSAPPSRRGSAPPSRKG